jgi:hypothetical protein
MLHLFDKLPKPIKIFFYNLVFAVIYPIIKYFRYDSKKQLYIMPANCRDPDLIVSLTSSPQRLKKLPEILNNICKCVFEVHINLPIKYRGTIAYEKNDLKKLLSFDNVKIFWFLNDLGPIMKILPTLKRLLHTNYTIVTIDDDSMYANSCFLNLPNNIASGKITTELIENDVLNLPYGVETISYPMPLITKNFIQILELMAKNAACKLHDDFCIGIAIKHQKLKIQHRQVTRFLRKEAITDFNALIYEDRSFITQKCNEFAKTIDIELR